jgi:hypothetical protein
MKRKDYPIKPDDLPLEVEVDRSGKEFWVMGKTVSIHSEPPFDSEDEAREYMNARLGKLEGD